MRHQDVGGGKPFRNQKLPSAEAGRQHFGGDGKLPDRGFNHVRNPALFRQGEAVLGHRPERLLQFAHRKEAPLVIAGAFRGAERRGQTAGGKSIADIGANRRRLGQHQIAIGQGRHLAARIQRQISGLPTFTSKQVHLLIFILGADFLQRPDNASRTRVGTAINLEHASLSCGGKSGANIGCSATGGR